MVSVSFFLFLGLGFFAPFHLHLIPWATIYGVAASFYSFLLFLEFHDEQIALYVVDLLNKALYPAILNMTVRIYS